MICMKLSIRASSSFLNVCSLERNAGKVYRSVPKRFFGNPGFPLLEARDFQANLGRVGVAGGMLNITIMITGSHEISARDYGIEEPCWGSPF